MDENERKRKRGLGDDEGPNNGEHGLLDLGDREAPREGLKAASTSKKLKIEKGSKSKGEKRKEKRLRQKERHEILKEKERLKQKKRKEKIKGQL